MKTGIIIDDYKLPVFKKHLDQAGHAFTQMAAGDNTILLVIEVESHADIEALAPIVQAANEEARTIGRTSQ